MSLSILEIAAALRAGQVTSVDMTRACLAAAEETDPELHAFVALDHEGALDAASRADEILAEDAETGPLTGVPVAVKDIIDVEGQPTLCGSRAYPNDPAEDDATVVARLRAAGAVIIGKTTAHELACGVYSAPASNPWGANRVPGGSSGGSGAAVAAGIIPMALGSDTGGSIRIPASLCGVVGLKPTYGRVPTTGVEPLAWSLDHIGPLGWTVDDCALTLEAIAGPSPADPSTRRPSALALGSDRADNVEGLRLGVLEGAPIEPMQEAVAERFAAAVDRLTAAGSTPVRVRIPELAHTLAAEFGIVGPEAAEYHRKRLRSMPDWIDPDIRALLVAGLLLPSGQYIKSMRARRVITGAISRVFTENRLDALLTPTLPATAIPKNSLEIDYGSVVEPVTLSYVRTTAPFNLSGQPAISLPAGLDDDGLPVGLQVAAAPYDERMLLRVGRVFESLTTAERRLPPIHVERSVA